MVKVMEREYILLQLYKPNIILSLELGLLVVSIDL